MSSHLLSVTVEDKPGVLARVSSMFARRGFNIHSLAVGPTTDPRLSRMTIVVDAPNIEQIIKQLYKLVHVVKVTELASADAVEREIMLLRISADAQQRSETLDAAGIFEAKVVDVGATTITFELAGSPEKLADFLELMRPYGIMDLAKSGRIALAKGAKTRDTRRGKLRTA